MSRFTAQRIAQTLAEELPAHWDGRECIEELKRADYNWRQMEWIGWWFEYRAMKSLKAKGATPGPEFGAVRFDCRLDGVWDFKTHPLRNDHSYAYLNDEHAVDECLKSGEPFGWIIAVGHAIYDETGAFKTWHDQLKGEESRYVQQGHRVNRRSRMRKSAFELREIIWIELEGHRGVEQALQLEVLRRGLQAGQRNSDGSPRRPKYGFSYHRWKSYIDASTAEVRSGRVRVG